jgi:enoyl ACP reductase
VVRVALQEQAEVALTAPSCRAHRLTSRVAGRLGVRGPVLELDVTVPAELAGLADQLRQRGWDRVDGVVHALAYLPAELDASSFPGAPFELVAPALQVGAWSLPALAAALAPLLGQGSSIVGLTADTRSARAGDGWLGMVRGGLDAAARQLAVELGPAGVRVNLVACGPLATTTGRAVADFDGRARDWSARAPLGWQRGDATAVARTVVALLSDWLPATTGQVVPADGGAHAVG